MHLTDRAKQLLWWIGVPLFLAIVSYIPFLVIRCAIHPDPNGACWRLLSVGSIIFDGYPYMEFMAEALSGSDGGVHIGWFAWFVRATNALLPFLTNAELWLLLRWVTGVAGWWAASWTLGYFVPGMSVDRRRIAASVLFVSVFVVFGFRPGAYSWFLPFIFVALALCASTEAALREGRFVRAAGLSAAAFAVSTIYSWSFIFAAIWLGASWMARLSGLRLTRLVALWTLIAASAAIGVGSAAFMADPAWVQTALETYARNGLAFTRMPVLSMTLAAGALWATLLCVVRIPRDPLTVRSRDLLFLGWMVSVTGWLSSIATGVFIQNDHFRLLILIFAWMSAAAIAEWRSRSDDPLTPPNGPWRTRTLVAAAAGAWLVVCSYLIRPYAFDGDLLNTIHLAIWLFMALALSYAIGRRAWPPRMAAAVLIIASLVIAVPQSVVIFRREARKTPKLESLEPLLAEIAARVPRSDRVCADPINAELVGALGGRRSFMSVHNVYERQTDLALYGEIATLATAYDVPASGFGDVWLDHLLQRGVTCTQFPFSAASRALRRIRGAP